MSSDNPKLRNLLERIKQKILKIEGKDPETTSDTKIVQESKQESTAESKVLGTPLPVDNNQNYLDEIKNLLKQEEQTKNNDFLQNETLQNTQNQIEEQDRAEEQNQLEEQDQVGEKINASDTLSNNNSSEIILENQEQNNPEIQPATLLQEDDFLNTTKNTEQNTNYEPINQENSQILELQPQENEESIPSLQEEAKMQESTQNEPFIDLQENNNTSQPELKNNFDNLYFNQQNSLKKSFAEPEEDDDLIFHYVESKNETQKSEQIQSQNEAFQEQSLIATQNNQEALETNPESSNNNFDDEFLDDSDINISEDDSNIKTDENQTSTEQESSFDLKEYGETSNENANIFSENINSNDIFQNKQEEPENLTKQEPEESLILSENTEEKQQNLQQENDSLLIENTSQQNQVADATKNISETTDLDIPITSSNYEKILQNSTTDYDYLTQNIALETMNSNQSIINAQTQNQVKQALEKLHQTQQTINNANGMVSDENLAKLISNMLEPKLTEWLNSNLSSMVEKIVQEEINKLFANKK